MNSLERILSNFEYSIERRVLRILRLGIYILELKITSENYHARRVHLDLYLGLWRQYTIVDILVEVLEPNFTLFSFSCSFLNLSFSTVYYYFRVPRLCSHRDIEDRVPLTLPKRPKVCHRFFC